MRLDRAGNLVALPLAGTARSHASRFALASPSFGWAEPTYLVGHLTFGFLLFLYVSLFLRLYAKIHHFISIVNTFRRKYYVALNTFC